MAEKAGGAVGSSGGKCGGFLNSSCDSEIVWLVSSYVLYVWETVHVKNSEVKFDKFFGYLTFKYKMHQATSQDQLINLHYI